MPEDDVDDAQEEAGVRPFWSGTISFGLVSIPVNLYAASRPGGVRLRMLGPDEAPVRREYVCSKDGQGPLGDDDLVRGYRQGDAWVLVTDEELEALAPEKSRDIDLRRFVPRRQLDPLYFERGYFLGPAGESTKAYRLLAEAMRRTGRAGIATFVMRGREHLVAILSDGGILRAETLRFADEVRSPDDVGLPEAPAKVDEACVEELRKALEDLCEEELPLDALKDEHADAVRALAEKKRKKDEDVVVVDEAAVAAGRDGGGGADSVDLMRLIQQSLKGAAEAGPAPRRARTKREAGRRRKAGKRAARSS